MREISGADPMMTLLTEEFDRPPDQFAVVDGTDLGGHDQRSSSLRWREISRDSLLTVLPDVCSVHDARAYRDRYD